ncbi:ATP-binding protein [candidate division KSB1 bacterium]
MLNRQFSRTISEAILTNFIKTHSVFEELINFRQNELNLLSEIIADIPKFKAAVGTSDVNTIRTELEKLPEFASEIDLYIVADTNNKIVSGIFTDNTPLDEINRRQIEAYISGMEQFNDLWIIGTNLYQIAAHQIDIVIPGASGEIGYFMIIGDRIDDSFAHELKNLTNTDITIGESFIFGSTFEAAEDRTGALLVITGKLSGSNFQAAGIDDGTETVTINGEDHVMQSGLLSGQARTPYILTRPLEKELIILSQLKNYALIIIVSSMFLVFVASYFSARRLTNPLNRLLKGTQAIASGDYDSKVFQNGGITSSGDEIHSLAGSFEKMRIALKNNIHKITALNTELFDKNEKLQNALEELKKAQEELIKSERMSTLGKMASSIIHDFKSPMQVIKGMSQLVAMPNVDETKKQDLLHRIDKAVNQMNDMTYEILDFVRGETHLSIEMTKMSELINELLIHLSIDLQTHNIKVTKTCEFDPEVPLDKTKIKRVLENIIRNAIEASSDNAELSVSTQQVDNTVLILIGDNGSGIPEEIVDNLFEPFVTKGKSSGTGLGLAIAKKLVDDHKGSISVRSEVGKGTQFEIALPLRED